MPHGRATFTIIGAMAELVVVLGASGSRRLSPPGLPTLTVPVPIGTPMAITTGGREQA
jgi:hypothetical protein